MEQKQKNNITTYIPLSVDDGEGLGEREYPSHLPETPIFCYNGRIYNKHSMPSISYNNLPTSTPAEEDVVKAIAEDINAVIGGSADDVRGRIGTLLRLPISERDAKLATTQIKTVYEQLTKKETLVTTFETAERIALYQADVVEKLRGTFSHTNIDYNVIGSIGQLRQTARDAMAVAQHATPTDTPGGGPDGHTTPAADEHAEVKGIDQPPEGGILKKMGRTAGVAGLTVGASAGTMGLVAGGVKLGTWPIVGPILNAPVFQTIAGGLNTAATTVPWLSWPLNALAWAAPGLGVGALTVGGLWTLGKIREGSQRRAFYKHTPGGRFPKNTFLENVAGGAGLLLSPFKLIPGVPRAIGSVAHWGGEKIGNGAAWVGENAGTLAKGVGVGTLIGGGAVIAGVLASPAAALAVGAGVSGLYTWLNRKGASGSGDAAAPAPAGHP